MEILGRDLGAEIFHDILIYKQEPPFGMKICLDICPDIICSEKRKVLRERANFQSGVMFRPIACE